MTTQDVFYLVMIVVSGLAIGVGVMFPALAQARAAARAMDAMARQPDQSAAISRNLYIGLAMIESQALYVLIVVLIILFANPLSGHVPDAVAKGGAALWFLIGSGVAAATSIALGTMLSSFGQGRVTAASFDAVAEQPAAANRISTTLYISLAFLESLALYALIVSLVLLFVNPLLSEVV